MGSIIPHNHQPRGFFEHRSNNAGKPDMLHWHIWHVKQTSKPMAPGEHSPVTTSTILTSPEMALKNTENLQFTRVFHIESPMKSIEIPGSWNGGFAYISLHILRGHPDLPWTSVPSDPWWFLCHGWHWLESRGRARPGVGSSSRRAPASRAASAPGRRESAPTI